MAFGPVVGRGAKVGMQGPGAAAQEELAELAELDLDLHLELALPPLPPAAEPGDSASTPTSPPSEDGGASFRSSSDSASPRNAGEAGQAGQARLWRLRGLAPAASDPQSAEQASSRAHPGPHPSSPLLIARPSVAVRKYTEPLDRRHSVCRAALIRANACRFADRYEISQTPTLVGQGTFGRVYECVDKLADIKRAVKRLRLPAGALEQRQLVNEVDALIALDHPAIVRLIEYFVADAEVLLVMELLQGPSLGEKLRELGRFSETFAVRCLRHMLKALFCCHCHGIAHNDVSEENFRFETSRADAALRMVDFGLSEMSAEESAANADGAATAQGAPAGHCPVRGLYVQKRDIWSVGTILYEMLAGAQLFPTEALCGLPEATNPSYVPSRLRALSASEQARDLLAKMLEPSTDRRIAAQEALQHPLVVQSYALAASEASLFGGTAAAVGFAGVGLASLTSRRRRLAGCVPALRAFAKAPRLKRLALLVAAHLLGDEVGGLRWLFRFLARDAWLVEESVFASALREAGEELPKDFSMLFRCADLSGSGALNFVEFMAAMMANLPEVYCSDSSLKAVFHFFDSSGHGIIRGDHLHLLFPARPEDECALMIRQSCGKDSMSFVDFQRVMTPANWKPSGSLAKWADVPDVASPVLGPKPKLLKEQQRGSSSDPERECQCQVTSRVTSTPSEAFAIRQKPGFHRKALRPFYAAQPVSNVVLGLASGSSGYARRAQQLRCTHLVESGVEEQFGAFFFMPNPKYHWTPEAAFNEERKARFVAWWIHPELCPMLRAWTRRCGESEAEGREGESSGLKSDGGANTEAGVGAPGDFGYSEMLKSSDYLHTCRDLCGATHVRMLEALVQGIKTYLERMFGEALAAAHVSAGFHYPVRPQYSTLHLQIRVNAGDVCPGEGRGVDLFRLQNRLKSDPECFQRDDETLFYEATANLRMALLKACDKAPSSCREVGPKSLVLGE